MPISKTQQRLQEEARARRARFAEAGRRYVEAQAASAAARPVPLAVPAATPAAPRAPFIAGLMTTVPAKLAVMEAFDINDVDLTAHCRRSKIAHARQAAMMLVREHYGRAASSPWIGRHFNRDHSTVIHSIEAAQERTKSNEEYRAKVERARVMARAIWGKSNAE